MHTLSEDPSKCSQGSPGQSPAALFPSSITMPYAVSCLGCWDLQTGIHLWLAHDGASHFILAVWQLLNNAFPEQRIAPGGPNTRHARSPELNRSEFYISRHQDVLFCATEGRDAHNLQRLQNELDIVRSVYHFCNIYSPTRYTMWFHWVRFLFST